MSTCWRTPAVIRPAHHKGQHSKVLHNARSKRALLILGPPWRSHCTANTSATGPCAVIEASLLRPLGLDPTHAPCAQTSWIWPQLPQLDRGKPTHRTDRTNIISLERPQLCRISMPAPMLFGEVAACTAWTIDCASHFVTSHCTIIRCSPFIVRLPFSAPATVRRYLHNW